MSENEQNPITNVDTWLRLAYMLFIGLLATLARYIILVLSSIQFIFVLVTGKDHRNLRKIGLGLANWSLQAYEFLSFNTETKPYPFTDWPVSEKEEKPRLPGEYPEQEHVTDGTTAASSEEKPDAKQDNIL
jgi:hypothetical protein